MAAASITITETGNKAVIDASLAIIKNIFDADLTTPEGTVAAAVSNPIQAYRETVREAKLRG
jgi:hypothetical protein